MPARDAALFARLSETLGGSWRLKARPEQLAPDGDWFGWLILAGRGWGKTRTGAEWVQEQVQQRRAGRIALVAATAADARDVIVEGPSGLLAIAPKHMRPEYEPSKRRLTWPNGAVASTYSADEPERLRGPEHDSAWCDELGAWRYPEAWDMLMFGLRLGRPRCVVTTTPKPVRLIRDLLARSDVRITRGRTMDNAANLAPSFIDAIQKRYGGTRLGRQEIDGELLQDVPGALWQREWIDQDRVTAAPEDLRRIVVAIDPAVTNTENSDETGIIVAGLDAAGHVYVLDDLTARLGPLDWARLAVAAYRRHQADRIVAEVNNGGELVSATVRMVDAAVPFREVRASRGKAVRAEPVSALYEQHKVHHVGSFTALEDQMCAFTADFNRSTAGYSPDRVDALVWAITELAVVNQGGGSAAFGSYGTSSELDRGPAPDWIRDGWTYPHRDERWFRDIRLGLVDEVRARSAGWIGAPETDPGWFRDGFKYPRNDTRYRIDILQGLYTEDEARRNGWITW
ncbi:ATP-binding protein [Methylobacterium terrae]|uniref:ATP-binding protein n=1 Tax=Methylobacterium terrae TaxID=2202827 RepID=A0A2U8WLY5_9HYPH|nr:terminase family protein [Methylobacterium terrae]AWN47153.1 ATP-binding protein [Methylobacterium terrae]